MRIAGFFVLSLSVILNVMKWSEESDSSFISFPIFEKTICMKYLFILLLCSAILASCKEKTPDKTQNEELILDTTPAVDTTTTSYVAHDPKWYTKDLFDADDENYLLESTTIFRTRFDSIMKHYNWKINLGEGTYEKKTTYDIYTMPIDSNIKIIARLQKKHQRITKLILIADGFEEEHNRAVIKAMKGLVLATLNSNFDAEDAELILHQTGILNDGIYGPGVLKKDGHRYESHKFGTKMYFGISW